MASEHLGYYFKRINEAFVARTNKSLKKFNLRQRNVNLTQKAFEVKQYILNHRQKIQNSFSENFSESELESLVKSLKKVYDILQKECEK